MEQTFIQKAETYKSIYIIKTKIKYKGDTMLEPGSRMREVMKEYEKKECEKHSLMNTDLTKKEDMCFLEPIKEK